MDDVLVVTVSSSTSITIALVLDYRFWSNFVQHIIFYMSIGIGVESSADVPALVVFELSARILASFNCLHVYDTRFTDSVSHISCCV